MSYFKPWIYGNKRVRLGDAYYWQGVPTIEEIKRDAEEDVASMIAMENARKANPEHADKTMHRIVELTKAWLDNYGLMKCARNKYDHGDDETKERMSTAIHILREQYRDIICNLHEAFTSLGIRLDINPTPKFWEEGGLDEYKPSRSTKERDATPLETSGVSEAVQ
jgi:hypothetical protein